MEEKRENMIQELPELLHEAYLMADDYAASTKRNPEMQEKLREKMIEINHMMLEIAEG